MIDRADWVVSSPMKAIPLQAWAGPEGSNEVEAPRIQDNRHMKQESFQLYAPAVFTLQEIFLVLTAVTG
jgi:hypothetical protein